MTLICYSFWVHLRKDTFVLLLPLLLLLFFCLFIIQIATLLGWIRWVSSTSHLLGFPSRVLECFQLFKTVDGPRVTLVPCDREPSPERSLGVGEERGCRGPRAQPALKANNLSSPRTAEASRKKRENRRKWKRYLLIGLATVGGGTVIGKAHLR